MSASRERGSRRVQLVIDGVPPGCGGGGAGCAGGGTGCGGGGCGGGGCGCGGCGGSGGSCGGGGGRDMMFDSLVRYRVNGAKSVDTASSLALKARHSAGRNWPHSERA